jgi:GNAT superfamily N-acetyltransferase
MTRIVRATEKHTGSIATLMAASPLLRRYRVTRARARTNLSEARRRRDILLAAVDDGAVVGFAWLITTRALDRSAYLRLLLVAEGRQSAGLGAALLSRAERQVRKSGSRHLVLLVTKTNRRARAFYEQHGYAHVGDLAGFVRAGITESLYLKSWRSRPAASTRHGARRARATSLRGRARARPRRSIA